MSTNAQKAFALFQSTVGQEEGVGEWFTVDQNRINQFADVTIDHQFIHVDPEAAKATPFGTTIAHGFLTLSLLTHLDTSIPKGDPARYASKWHGRSAYRFSTEITVYLAPAHVGRGIGSQLYARLFPILRDRGIHAVIGGIALPNEASVALHEKFGLEKVAHFKEVGYKFDRWIDVGSWQGIL